ncbi:MAG TPA: hypothetical protein VM716_03955 [Gemmatimonadales bacterium]|nr:hypothetical protein [Gemmatimonadales bacterium]
MKVRIVARPAGEAPDDVREAWVGLELPVLTGLFGGRRLVLTAGVLSGPRSWMQRLLALVGRRFDIQSGYAVNALEAVNILGKKSPMAASWWRARCAHLLDGKHALVFATDVCEEC